MKYLAIAVLLFFSEVASAKDLKFSVSKMTCPSCAASIEKEVNKITGVTNLQIDIGASTVLVSVAENSTISRDVILAAIKKAGFVAE